jgi:glucosamine-6-phosphate deaminase
LDEYIGIPITHRASFRKYLKERFFDQVNVKAYHLIDGEHNPEQECKRLSGIIEKHPIDVAFVGIGENGHLAFNDPPADFHTKEPYIIVELDEACRMQQLGEGWFPDLASVPKRAISMSIQQIMGSKNIICSVPDLRKAQAVKACLEGEISPKNPASILQHHGDCRIFLDSSSSSLLSGR